MTSWARRVSAVALPALLLLGLAVPPAAADPSSAYGSWSTAAPVPHVSQGAVSLGDGSVLAFGSSTTGNDRYDPSTNTWHATAAVPDLRAKLGVRLENGSALLVDETGRATVYDPSSDSYSPVTTTGLPYTPEALFALPGGDALVTQKTFYASGDLGAVFHGQTRTWTVLQGPRGGYRFDERNTAVLPSGDVYVTGDGNLERAAWSYDASTDTWTTRSAPPPTGAYAFTTYDGELSFTDHLYDPASDTWRPVPTELYSLYGSAAVNGDDELAAPAGGRAAVYDGATDLWTEIAGPSVSAHWSRSVVVPLADGGALAVGGYSASSNVNLTDAARFSPGHFVAAPTTPAQRADVLAEVTSPSYLPQRTVHVRAVLRDVATHDRLAGVTADLWQRTAGGWNKVASDTSDSLGVAELVFDSPADGRSLVVRVPAAPGLRPGGSEELDPNLRDQQIPSVPVGVVAVHGLSDHKTRISWVSPDDEGGTPVTSYEYSDQYGGIVRSSVPGSARTLLINGDESHGYLRAVNAVGPGFWVEWNATEGSTATEPPSELCGRSSGATTLGAGTYRVCRSGYHLDPGASLSLDGTGGQVIVGGGTITARAATIRSQGSTRLTSPLALSELGHLLLSGTEVGDVQATGLAEVRLTGDAAGNLITAETPTWVSGGSLGSLHTSCVRRDCEARLTNVDVGSGGVSISGSARVSLKGVAVHGVQGWPVTLTGATFTLGSGGDVDGVTGSGNGIEALNLSSTVTNTITWRDVAAEGQSDVELGYAAANLVAAAGVTVPDSTRLGFVRCSTYCAGLKSDGPVNAGSGTEFGGSTSSFLTPTATVLVRGPGSATLTSSLVHGRFELAGPATGSFTDTELRGGDGLSVHPGDLFVNVPPPPAPKVDLVRTTATQGAGISISRATSTLTGVTVNGGGGVSVSLGSTTVTDLTVHQGSLGMSLLHGSTVKGVQVTDSPGPAVLLSLDGVSFGPGQDVDGLVGSGNGDDSVGISGNIPNALTWLTPSPSSSLHPLGYVMTDSLAVGGGVVFPQGSTVRLSGGLSTAAGDLDASAGGTVFEGLPASYCSLGYCPAPHRGFYLTAQSGALRLDHATLTGGEAELVGTGSLSVTNSTVTTAPEAYYDNAIGGFGSSVVVTHNVVQGRIGASSFTHAVIDDNVVTVTGPTSDNLAPAAINVRGAGVTTAADLEVARNTVSGADSGILLSQLRTTVGTGGSVHDNLGSGNNSNAVLMQNVRLDADLDWVAVPSGLVPQPLGYVADYVEVLHHDVVVPADTAVRASQLSVTGGAFDASAGLATITGATQPDAVVYVVSDGVRAGKALLTQATFTGTLYATGTTPQAGQQVVIDHSSVIDTVRSTGVPTTVSDSVVSILQVDNSRYNPAQTDGPTQVRNSRLTLTAQSTSALDLLGVQISGGGLGLGLSDATGQLSCLDVTDNSFGVGVQGHPVTITSSNIRGNTQADVEGNGDLSTDDVYWGQPGGPRPEQVSGSVALHDTNPRSTPAPCAVATPTPPPGVPGPLTSTPGLHGFALSWTAPTAGAPVTGYEVSVLDDQGSPVNQHSVDAGTTQTAVAGLTNGKTYELVVRAFSGAVAGPTSRLLVVLPLVPPPGPVTNVKVGVVGNRASTTWTNPTDAGYSATKVELVRAGSGDAPSTLVDAATTSVGTPALLTDTAYDLVITAHDADGGFTTPVVVHLRGSSTSLAVDRTSVVDGSSVLATAEVHRDDGQALGGRVVNLVGKAGKAAVSLGHCTTAANGRCQVRFTPPRNLTLTAVAPAAGQSTASTSAARSVSVSPRITTATSRTAYTRSTRTTVSVAVRTPQAGHALQLQWWSGHNWYVVGHADEDSRGRAHLPFTVRPGRQLYRVLDSASGGFCTGTSATFAITGQ